MVNIKDFEFDKEAVQQAYQKDMLASIFLRQEELMAKYHDIEARNGAVVVEPNMNGNIDNRHVQIRIKDMMWRCVEELGEAANTLKNKPWKQDAKITDKLHFYEEIADALHFFVEMCIVAGLDADDLFALYFRKSEVNKFRQRSNY